MSPADVAVLADEQIIELVVDLVRGGEISSIVGDPLFMALCELRKRHVQTIDVPRTPSGRLRVANSVELDADRWRMAWYRRRLTMTALSELAGKCRGWANVITSKKCCAYHVLDQIAAELGETTDDLVWEVASDRERQRLSFV